MNPKELKEVLPLDKAYEDALRPAMKQIGLALESAAKVSRFILAPIDYIAAYSERWQRYLKRVAEKVDDGNLVEGNAETVIPSLEALSITNEEGIRCELLINLLAAAIDKTKQDLAHPSFPGIIKQLSSDEAVILYYLKMHETSIQQVYLIENYGQITIDELLKYGNIRDKIWMFDFQKALKAWMYLEGYLDHLESLALVVSEGVGKEKVYFLSLFGHMFNDVCTPKTFPEIDMFWKEFDKYR